MPLQDRKTGFLPDSVTIASRRVVSTPRSRISLVIVTAVLLAGVHQHCLHEDTRSTFRYGSYVPVAGPNDFDWDAVSDVTIR